MKRSNWDVLFFRICFVTLITGLAAAFRPFDLSTTRATATGVFLGLLATAAGGRLRRAGMKSLVAGSVGTLMGALLGIVFVSMLPQTAVLDGTTAQFFRVAVPLVGGYLGLLAGMAKSDLLRLDYLGLSAEHLPQSSINVVDTSVIIDGRIADIAEAGFLSGKLIVPQFVLYELQLVADSSDSAKRNRGRRGLDIVRRLQNMPRMQLEVSAQDFPEIREVDLKLIEFAKEHKAKIVTNDFNLNKVAQLQGVEVLNINELANALKPVVLPGESMRVFILKEGKEHNQGVAYLDDGTMVVVDNARRFISKTVDITVTSVLQTTAGKMIFGKYDERPQASGDQRPITGASAAGGS